MVTKIRPVLVIYIPIVENSSNTLNQLGDIHDHINRTISSDEYVTFIIPTTERKEAKLELLNPNIVTEDEQEEYLMKLNEIQKTMDSFIENCKQKENE
jgi:chorismate-pyruvate lyase